MGFSASFTVVTFIKEVELTAPAFFDLSEAFMISSAIWIVTVSEDIFDAVSGLRSGFEQCDRFLDLKLWGLRVIV
jgi:hypothetical protein